MFLSRRHFQTSLLLLLSWLAGCATIFTGTRDTLKFDANVPGVRLWIDGEYKGELPLTIDMSRHFVDGRQFFARFEKEGYVTQEFRLRREINPVAILDVTSIVTSGGIDLMTGALMKFSPTDYHVQMLAAGQSPRSSEYRRSLELHGFALANFHRLQTDLARGGGEHLATFAAMVGGDAAGARLVTEEALRAAPALVTAPTAHAFVRRLDEVLAASPQLRAHRL